MKIVVKKFGGTSVGSVERIERVADRVEVAVNAGELPVLAVSAMSGETNRLIGLANQVDPSYRGPAFDMLVASGEQVSIALLAIALKKRGLLGRPQLAFQLGIKTDSIFSKARIQSIDGQALIEMTARNEIPIVAGFQGINEHGELTTLGRGGSDTTAVALAAAIGRAQDMPCECEIYTDVPAVYTADPRLVKQARRIDRLSCEEMMEMASLGSKILHVRCVELAAKYRVPLHVRSTFELGPGTVIEETDDEKNDSQTNGCGVKKMENPVVSAVTHESNTAVFKLFPVPFGPGFLADLFDGLAERGVVVDIITQSQNEEGQRLAFSITNEDVPLAESYIKDNLAKNVELVKMAGMAKLSVVGVGMRNHPGVASRFFRRLDQLNIPVHLVTTSEIKISAVIDGGDLQKTAEAIHSEFGLDADREDSK